MEENLIEGDRRPNRWNLFQEQNPGLKKKDCHDLYQKVKEKIQPERRNLNKTRIRCNLDKFLTILSSLTSHQKEVIERTPFASLLDLQKGSLTLQRDLIKSIVSHFDYNKMTLKVYKGRETQEFPVTVEDFSLIMGLQNGEGGSVGENGQPDADLVKKFCTLEKNDKYKYIDIGKVENELKDASEENDIKQTFAIISMYYIVCPPPAGKLGKRILMHVNDVAKLHEQQWATIGFDALTHGIRTYSLGEGNKEKNLGGCVLFLQLFCMKKRLLMDGLQISEISESLTENFHKSWMIDHAPEKKRKKYLVDKIRKGLRNNLAQPEKVGLQLLLELDAWNEKCENAIAEASSQSAPIVNEEFSYCAWNALTSEDAISPRDRSKLSPGSCLNSNLMNAYIRYLQQKPPTNVAISDYHLFNTFFYPNLEKALSPKVIAAEKMVMLKRWWDNDTFKKEYIVIPIFYNNHWSMVIVCMRNDTDGPKPVILHMDSLEGTHNANRVHRIIKRFIEREVNCDSSIETVKVQVPQQKNEYDCGLYALLFIEHFMGQAPKRMETEYTTMFGKDWFSETDADELRRRMNDCLPVKRITYERRHKKQKTNVEESSGAKVVELGNAPKPKAKTKAKAKVKGKNSDDYGSELTGKLAEELLNQAMLEGNNSDDYGSEHPPLPSSTPAEPSHSTPMPIDVEHSFQTPGDSPHSSPPVPAKKVYRKEVVRLQDGLSTGYRNPKERTKTLPKRFLYS
ncbi:hypothetical protein CASFOL_042971 [Castilleja foliolosa]|uniref:Ubiquitin-like protease family profile domain-containing protein n=1 Tax=Castilleja foliolosa TaxID=1961234 RepID=A0ABD3B746_9LAMI